MRVLGVDGGQSGIRLRASDRERVLEVDGVSRGEGDIVAAVADAVAGGWRDGRFGTVDRVVLGLTTASPDIAGADRLCALVARATGAPEVWLADDAVTAHAGALSMGWGVSLVAGTGVACLALPEAGEPRILGGHGYLLGDEGGAYWIGRLGLNAALRAGEHRAPATTLRAAAAARFGHLEDLHVRLHDAQRPIREIASFAPDVLAAADDGDGAAHAIVVDAASELAATVVAGAIWCRETHPGGAGAYPAALGGRLLEPGTALRRELDAALVAGRAPLAPRTADASPLDGAILLGLAPAHRYGSLVHRWPGGPA
jgi:glucosamine kinase